MGDMPTFICSFTDAVDQTVVVKGKTVRFEFSEMFGPTLVGKDGEPLERQPIREDHPFWPPFRVWLGQWRAANPRPAPKPGPSDHLDKSRKAQS